MKLDAAQLPKVEQQLGVNAIPEEHPIISDPKEVFGDHTFFIDTVGVMIVVPKPMTEKPTGQIPSLEENSKLYVFVPRSAQISQSRLSFLFIPVMDVGSSGAVCAGLRDARSSRCSRTAEIGTRQKNRDINVRLCLPLENR